MNGLYAMGWHAQRGHLMGGIYIWYVPSVHFVIMIGFGMTLGSLSVHCNKQRKPWLYCWKYWRRPARKFSRPKKVIFKIMLSFSEVCL